MKKEITETSFNDKMSFSKLFLIFIIGSFIGTYYEQILTLVRGLLSDGSFIWESRRGVIYLPLSPIYGAGLVLMTYLLGSKERKWYMTLLYGALIGGVFEYSISFLQETFIGTHSWNYHNSFLNINGRTTIPFMIFWGLGCLLYIKYIYPTICKLIANISADIVKPILIILVIMVGSDMLISWSALIRQNLRRKGYEPLTIVGKFYDDYYTDDILKKSFPNMRVNK